MLWALKALFKRGRKKKGCVNLKTNVNKKGQPEPATHIRMHEASNCGG